jgi:hypothetical protein
MLYIATIIAAFLWSAEASAQKTVRFPPDHTDRVCVNRCVSEPDQKSFKACYAECVRRGR